jgi:hypothetical protein
MVIGIAIDDAPAVIDALADPETLYVFGVVAARTSKLGRRGCARAGHSRWPGLSRSIIACPTGAGDIDRDLGVLDPPSGAGVLALHSDRALTLLLRSQVSSTTRTPSGCPRCSAT